MAWEVQHHTLADGWINTWTREADQGIWEPLTYDSEDEAEFELAEFFREITLEVDCGERDADNIYDASEFRVVKVEEGFVSGRMYSQIEKE
jgi:hypothetical protein